MLNAHKISINLPTFLGEFNILLGQSVKHGYSYHILQLYVLIPHDGFYKPVTTVELLYIHLFTKSKVKY